MAKKINAALCTATQTGSQHWEIPYMWYMQALQKGCMANGTTLISQWIPLFSVSSSVLQNQEQEVLPLDITIVTQNYTP